MIAVDGMGAISEPTPGVFQTTGINTAKHTIIERQALPSAGVLGDNDLLVAQHAGGANMSVDVGQGEAWVLNSSFTNYSTSQPKYWGVIGNDNPTNVVINANASGNPRITSIFMKVDTTVTPDGSGGNVATIIALDGTPAGSPTPPATPNNHLRLADITVGNGVSSIVTANIVDVRVVTGVHGKDWKPMTETWTYSGSTTLTNTNVVYEGTMYATGDLRTNYYIGQKVKLTQAGVVKNFVVTFVAYGAPNTTLSLYGGTDNQLANSTIYTPYYSTKRSPTGFNIDPSKWNPLFTRATSSSQASPVSGTVYNLGGQINLPIGVWGPAYRTYVMCTRASTGFAAAVVGLSTVNNTIGDTKLQSYCVSTYPVNPNNMSDFLNVNPNFTIALTSDTTYYLNAFVSGTTHSTLQLGVTGDPNIVISASFMLL